MSTPVNLPALGESVTEGTITRWLKQVGDTVEVDEPLLEVSTDKVDTEIPSPVSGTLLEIKAEEDETVEVGAELCLIGDEGEGGGSSDTDTSDSQDSEDDTSDDDSEETRRTPTTTIRGGGTCRGARGHACRGDTRREADGHEERWRPGRHAAGPGRVGHRRHHHALAEVGR